MPPCKLGFVAGPAAAQRRGDDARRDVPGSASISSATSSSQALDVLLLDVPLPLESPCWELLID